MNIPTGVLFYLIVATVEVAFGLQATLFLLNLLQGPSNGFFSTENLWAWVLGFLTWMVAVALIHGTMRFVNAALAFPIGVAGALLKRDAAVPVGGVPAFYLILWLFWIVASLPISTAILSFFASHPELNSWLAAGSSWAQVLTYLAVLGLLSPGSGAAQPVVEEDRTPAPQ